MNLLRKLKLFNKLINLIDIMIPFDFILHAMYFRAKVTISKAQHVKV